MDVQVATWKIMAYVAMPCGVRRHWGERPHGPNCIIVALSAISGYRFPRASRARSRTVWDQSKSKSKYTVRYVSSSGNCFPVDR